MCKQPSQAESTDGDMRQGYALLLAVIIVSAVLSGALALAGIVISEIRQTRELSDAVRAQTAAGTDIEQALFLLRKGTDVPTTHGAIDRGGISVERRVAPELEAAEPYRIDQNDFISLPLAPNDSARSNVSIPQWTASADCQDQSWIEIAYVVWDPATGGFSVVRQSHARSESQTGLALLIPAHTQEVRIRALYCDISGLTVSNLPARIVIGSTATIGSVKQAVEITVPRVAPVAGLFDFVVFSECSILKGVANNSQECPQAP